MVIRVFVFSFIFPSIHIDPVDPIKFKSNEQCSRCRAVFQTERFSHLDVISFDSSKWFFRWERRCCRNVFGSMTFYLPTGQKIFEHTGDCGPKRKPQIFYRKTRCRWTPCQSFRLPALIKHKRKLDVWTRYPKWRGWLLVFIPRRSSVRVSNYSHNTVSAVVLPNRCDN